ncbi:hypothetical protein [Acidithiobacillus acidisediminis]|uniref:hypothetical protein n=1 Tax=Acidithiobacillus TaxID=119977 RepID=UPI0020101020|nr:hypothetical protein [Acidithiobacillus sp. S30A2]
MNNYSSQANEDSEDTVEKEHGDNLPEGAEALIGGLIGTISKKKGFVSPGQVDFDGEIGSDEPIGAPDIDIALYPSREIPVAGELWSVSGHLSNRSTKPIWIVDQACTLSLAPEIYGQNSRTGSIGAFFPTIQSRPFSEIVRIDPGATYSVVWKIDPHSSKDGGSGADLGVVTRVYRTIRSYLFFSPGKFKVNANVHIWPFKPAIGNRGNVTNYGSSFVKTISTDIQMDASPWVLILGAAIGGILCFILQMLFGDVHLGPDVFVVMKAIAVGLMSAILLSGVMTVLLSRLATTDFLLVVKVKDVWGAVATGFIVQWFGFPMLQTIITNAGK